MYMISSTFLSPWKEKRPKETRLDKRLNPFLLRVFRGLLNSFGQKASLKHAAIQRTGKSSLERDVYTGKNVVDSESHRQKKDSNTPALLSLSCVLPDLTGHY